jgi:DNA-binding response OmpR family regulator
VAHITVSTITMPKVLLVEDDADMAAEIKAVLRGNRLVAEVVPTAEAARDYLALSKYDLVILDWSLPDGDGVAILQELRKNDNKVPVLMLTGRSAIEDKKAGFYAGADDYLTKPFHRDELECRVLSLLRRQAVRLSDTLTAGDVVLDLQARRVTKGGEEIHLMPKELALLEFFMRHPNAVYTAQTLLERIWQTDNESTPKTVITTIHRLRKKIDTGTNTMIRNSFGSGYIFHPPED